ncbi:hypothetical protein AVEN_205020-1 [Araneus ventricosus]|uniref:Uncharacterized protein n=1 Tax=Araneus ventricosus TaxID=182803 RepID=A0A4Y2RFS5_ARAVE|nr:hypothetical protein AVEN_136556-1 [Araneus ventricosus]GBN74595.1 hypothetical protein AVEN_187164-1 [Araneus ventricosus]GBN76100.1 hypothetical protein AVEN_39629-1 [Araneus ventricosus]GBN76101.1 hypothetical protein AVEN_205020-1 [Araneus ventricosus]
MVTSGQAMLWISMMPLNSLPLYLVSMGVFQTATTVNCFCPFLSKLSSSKKETERPVPGLHDRMSFFEHGELVWHHSCENINPLQPDIWYNSKGLLFMRVIHECLHFCHFLPQSSYLLSLNFVL